MGVIFFPPDDEELLDIVFLSLIQICTGFSAVLPVSDIKRQNPGHTENGLSGRTTWNEL